MKKKILAVILAATMALSLVACGGKDGLAGAASTESSASVEGGQSSTSTQTSTSTEKEANFAGSTFDNQETSTDGYKHMLCKELESGDGIKANAFVFSDGDVYDGDSYANCECAGIDMSIEIGAYIRSDFNDYTLKENLKYYLEQEYQSEYVQDTYYDVVIGDVIETEKGCYAVVEYLYYTQYDNSYEPYFDVEYITQFDSGLRSLLDISVEANETTDKTIELLDELSTYYEIDINFDKSSLEKKQETFLANTDTNFYREGDTGLHLSLPIAWEYDYENSDYPTCIYAPEGDATKSAELLSVERGELEETAAVEVYLNNMDQAKASFKEYFEGTFETTVSDIEIKDLGDTVKGKALLVSTSYDSEGDKICVDMVILDTEDYQYYLTCIYFDESPKESISAVYRSLEIDDVTGKKSIKL